MNKNYLVVGVVALVLVGGFFMMRKPQEEKMAPETLVTPTVAMEKTSVQTVTVVGKNFSFEPKEITVKKGDTVKVIFKNAEGFHDFVIDELNARTKQLKEEAEETIEFVAGQVGTFEYYCSVGQHRKNGMVGKLIVQ